MDSSFPVNLAPLTGQAFWPDWLDGWVDKADMAVVAAEDVEHIAAVEILEHVHAHLLQIPFHANFGLNHWLPYVSYANRVRHVKVEFDGLSEIDEVEGRSEGLVFLQPASNISPKWASSLFLGYSIKFASCLDKALISFLVPSDPFYRFCTAFSSVSTCFP